MLLNRLSVSLREITAETVRRITDLATTESQKQFVANNAESLAEALFTPEAWYRAIYLAEDPVGFIMLYDESQRSAPPSNATVAIWRFMIHASMQGRGIGTEAIRQVIAHVRARRRFKSLELSYIPGPGNPGPFYLAIGFQHTGRIHDGEVVLEFPFGETDA